MKKTQPAKKSGKSKKLATIAAAFLFAAGAAQASDTFPDVHKSDKGELRPSVGALLGMSDPKGQLKPAFAWGAEFAVQPVVPFSVALQALHYSSHDNGVIDTNLKRTSVLLKLAYNFGGDMAIIKDLSFGLKTGALFDSVDTTLLGVTTNRTITRWGLGPVLGWDWMCCHNWSLGWEASYIFAFGPSPTNSDFNALGTIKYWF